MRDFSFLTEIRSFLLRDQHLECSFFRAAPHSKAGPALDARLLLRQPGAQGAEERGGPPAVPGASARVPEERLRGGANRYSALQLET